MSLFNRARRRAVQGMIALNEEAHKQAAPINLTPQDFFLVAYADFEETCILHVATSYEEARHILGKIRAFVEQYAQNAIESPDIDHTEEVIELNHKLKLALARKLGLNEYPFLPFLVDRVRFWREDPKAFVIMAFNRERGDYSRIED